ncbi:MAG: prefoldin subunit alpha [archaeon]|nr:prefoldin subunit alpha [archaeon]
MEMDESQQQLIFRLSMYEQQIQQIQQQLQLIEHGIIELAELNIDLEDLKGKKDKEILAPIGKGIFVKAKLLSEDLIVDIGDRSYVKKDIDQTKKIIERQVEKLENAKKELRNSLVEIDNQVSEMIEQAEKTN